MTCSRSHRWEGAELDSDPVPCLLPSRWAIPALILWGQQWVAFFGRRVQHPGRPRVNGWPWAWPCRSALAIGAHDNPMRRLKSHFPVEETEAQGRDATHTGLTWTGPSIWITREEPFTQITLRPAGLAGASLGLIPCLFLELCSFIWL